MTKKIRSLLITVIALGILLAAVLAINSGKNRNAENADTENPVPHTPSELVLIVDMQPETLRSLTTENDGGGMILSSMDGEAWLVAEMPREYRAKSSLMRSMVGNLSRIDGRVIEEDAADPSAYGLDKPAAKVRMKDYHGNEATVLFGSENPARNGRYAARLGSPHVYLVPSTKANKAFWVPSDIREDSLPEVNTEQLAEVRIRRSGREFHAVPHQGDLDPFRPLTSYLDIVSPWEGRRLLEDHYWKEFLAGVQLPKRVSGFPESQPENPADAGIGADADRIYLRDAAGSELDLIVGRDSGNSQRYAVEAGQPDIVFVLDAEKLGLLDADFFGLMSNFVFLAGIDRVTNISIEAPDAIHVLEIDKLGDPDDDSDDAFRFNGKEMSETDFKEIYQLIIALVFEGEAVESRNPPEAEISIKFTHVDPKVQPETVRFYPYDDVFYLAGPEGDPLEFLISRFQVDRMLDSLKSAEN